MRSITTLIILALVLGFSGSGIAQEPNPRITLISNVNVFDGKSDELQKNMHVLVVGNLIESISSEQLAVIQTDNVMVIDGGGRTLMPGLIDMHWHSAYSNIPMQVGLNTDLAYHTLIAAKGNTDALLRGLTTVRDVGGNVFSLAKLTDAGVYDGPRIFPAGPAISQTSGHTDFRPATAVPADPCAALIYMERAGHVMVADGAGGSETHT